MSKRPSAGGNIGGRRRADLAAQVFDHYETYGIYRWLRDDSKATGGRCTLAHIDGKERCYACNEIKLLEKEFGTDRTARDGHARAARCATPQPEQ